MSDPETYDELLKEMYGNREALVQALHFFNGEANRQRIRKHGDIPKGSMQDLIEKMTEWDVIEHVGQEPVGRGGPADVYQFTDLGRAISEPVVDDDSVTVDDVETLEEELQTHREAIEEHSESIDDLQQKYEDEVQELIDTVQGFIDDEENDASA